MGTQKNRRNETVRLSTKLQVTSDLEENIYYFTLKNRVYLDWCIQYVGMIHLSEQVKLA